MPENDEFEMHDHYYEEYCKAFDIQDGQIDYDSDRWSAFVMGLRLMHQTRK